jgi:hypothetical protein
VSGNFSAVENVPDSLKQHYRDLALQNIAVTKNGYLYVYVSNESPVNVFLPDCVGRQALTICRWYMTGGLCWRRRIIIRLGW